MKYLKIFLLNIIVLIIGFVGWMNATPGHFLFACISADGNIRPDEIVVIYASEDKICRNINPVENSKFKELFFVSITNKLDFYK